MSKYLKIQLKRMLLKLPAVFCVTLILLISIGFMAKGAIEQNLSGEKQKTIEVGIVGDTSEYMGIGILALQKLDSSRFTVHLNVMEEAEARKLLENGELDIYFEVPEGFVESVMVGENYKVKYYTGNGHPGLGTLLAGEFSKVMSELLTKSQNAVYGMQTLCREYGRDDFFWQATEELNILLIENVLTRQDIFEVETIGYADELSLTGYYICAFSILIFLFFGINGCFLFIREDISMKKLLAARGICTGFQILAEWIAYSALTAAVMGGVFALLGGVCTFAEIKIPEIGQIEFRTVMEYGFYLLPVMLMLTAMALLGHELADNLVAGILLQFLMAVSMGYVSGCFYPNTFFPEMVQMIGKILPSGVGMRYAAQYLKGETDLTACILLVGYMILFFVLLWYVRRRKILSSRVN